MALHLIHGPPNSGRTRLIRERLEPEMSRRPLLIAPTAEARFALEREVCAPREALIGLRVGGMANLAEEVLDATGAAKPPRPASPGQRQALVRAAADAADLRILARSARQSGFAAAAADLFSRLRAEGVEPDRRGEQPDPYLDEVMALYARYLERLAAAGFGERSDRVAAAAAALRERPADWGARPVFIHGFDDLPEGELELIAALAAAGEVTVSITFEDRPALAARAELLSRLRELEPAGVHATEPVPGYTESPVLHRLERSFGDPRPEAAPDRDGDVRLLRAAGHRGEAELIAHRIRKLHAGGEPLSEIAIALRNPDRDGPGMRAALERFGLPAALECELPVQQTAAGTAVLALLDAAFGSRDAAAVLRHLRATGGAPAAVDRVERRVLRDGLSSQAEARSAYRQEAGEDAGWLERIASETGDPEATAETLAELAVEAADRAGSDEELRAAGAIGAAARALAELGEAAPGPADLMGALAESRVRPWQGPTGERVRIASPYALRARRVRHLFIASLQDGEFPRAGGSDPFLSEDQRAALRIREPVPPEEEDLYIFHACLSLPTHGLWLSCRTADSEGKAQQPSPFLEKVEALIEPGGRGPVMIERRLDAVTLPPAEAPTESELARSLALEGHGASSSGPVDRTGNGHGSGAGASSAASGATSPAGAKASSGLPAGGIPGSVAARLREARRREADSCLPRPLRQPAVLEELASHTHFGATTLEQFAAYPYHWFISRELTPAPLGPDPEPLEDGSIAHAVLERLYREQPGGTDIPRPGTLAAWRSRAVELVAEECSRNGLSEKGAAERARRRRIGCDLAAFLGREAAGEEPAIRPGMLEASFGDRDEEAEPAERPALALDGWHLHGKIDRVDLEPGGAAGLLLDYKNSTQVDSLAKLERAGKLQLQLYLLALRELWGIEGLGALYHPLRATSRPGPRGLIRDSAAGDLPAWVCPPNGDRLGDEEFDAALDGARERATAAVAELRAGMIDGEPLEGARTDVLEWAPIDRRPRRPLEAVE